MLDTNNSDFRYCLIISTYSSREMVADIFRDSLRQAQKPSLTCSAMFADIVRDSCLLAQNLSETEPTSTEIDFLNTGRHLTKLR